MDEVKKQHAVDLVTTLHLPDEAQWYAGLGVPRRNGPPGTGKSSLSFALAGIVHRSLYTIHLGSGDLIDDALPFLMAAVPLGSIVLLEDIDNANPRMSMSALLNGIDGVSTAEGITLIGTA